MAGLEMQRMNPEEGARLLGERQGRLAAATRLEVPDRVPIMFFNFFWAGRYNGVTCRGSMYDYPALTQAWRRAIHELQPDAYISPFHLVGIGRPMETLGLRVLQWAGHGVGEDIAYQYLDKEYMKAEEYEEYLFDPTGFMLRTYLPRVAEAYEGLAHLPVSAASVYIGVVHAAANYARPDLRRSFEMLSQAGREMQEWTEGMMAFTGEMAQSGYLPECGGIAMAPFDYFADYMRGSKQAMLDMFRRKDKLLAAMEKMALIQDRFLGATMKDIPCKTVFMPLHWCLDGFMSEEQFRTFYWPQLRQVVINLIDKGLTPCLLWEGDCTSRLEIIADIPKGKAIYWFERSDIFKAKEILGDVVCIRGNVPAPMLTTGTADDVADYCRRLIKVVGRDGGFIMDGAIGIPDEAKPECVKAMFETTRTYGVYG